MVKLELSKEIEDEHLTYFGEKILLELEKLPKKAETAEETEKFSKYCKENVKSIAIGKPEELKRIIKEVDELFPLITKAIKGKSTKKNVEEGNPYSKDLQKYFGYSIFIEAPKLENYIKDRAIELIYQSKGIEQVNYSKALSKYAHQAIKEVFCEHFYENSDDLPKVKDLENLLKSKNYTIILHNYMKLKQELLPWSAYKLAFLNKTTVCPYCNRQYITPVFSDDGKARGQFDHFFPKSRYPYLSMSLYNLIPSCSVCNSSLKGQKEFSMQDIHPYEENYHDFFDFYINPVDQANPRVEIEIHGKKEKETQNYLKMFQIEALYNYHTNQGIEMYQKSMIYTDSYVQELLENNPEMFQSEEDLKALIYGYILDEKEIGKEAFGKLRRDVAKQLGLIE